MIFAGGMPRACYGDRFTVSIMRGDSHVVLDFTSKVIDFVTLGKNDHHADVSGGWCFFSVRIHSHWAVLHVSEILSEIVDTFVEQPTISTVSTCDLFLHYCYALQMWSYYLTDLTPNNTELPLFLEIWISREFKNDKEMLGESRESRKSHGTGLVREKFVLSQQLLT